ncbi:hypothetical protein [Bacillus sp. 7884-1]|uniref:hypothetical protein n=1 Tax=Bacillus sp. 7884-1 TaxID=2021693 RepID=UPI000BA69D32|nr:hypothetical protein [Bacillus sp. 7884-1]PAE35446.1 hypothetical protein CHI06_23660 [Bacillus sp. 7884-1]
MRVFLSLLLIVGLLAGCNKNETEEPVKEKKVEATKEQQEEKLEKEEAKEATEEVKEEEPSIDISVFQYAKKVEVTDARDITKHITVTVFMSNELKEGLASQHVLNQTYDFVQQEDIEGANTLTVGVMVGDKRVLQYTVDITNFVPNNSEPMTNVVLAASKVEKITPEVEEFATSFDWKIIK